MKIVKFKNCPSSLLVNTCFVQYFAFGIPAGEFKLYLCTIVDISTDGVVSIAFSEKVD